MPVLKALNRATRALADHKGQARAMPNQGILIDTLALATALFDRFTRRCHIRETGNDSFRFKTTPSPRPARGRTMRMN